MNARVRAVLTDDEGTPFAGIGVIRLLRAIDEHGSINHAAKVYGLSYVKAWNMMNRLEKNIGKVVLKRTSGGQHGGGAELTPFGKRFLKSFEAYQDRMSRAAETGRKRFLHELNKEEDK